MTMRCLLSMAVLGLLFMMGCRKPSMTVNDMAMASIPPQPNLSIWPAELQERIAAAEERIRSAENPVEAVKELSRVYHINGYYSEASLCYSGLMAMEPENSLWPHQVAKLLSGLGKLEQALAYWQRSVRGAPENVPSQMGLGDVLLKLNRFVEADNIFQVVLKLDPDNPFALVGRARVAISRNDWQTAKNYLIKASEDSDSRIGADLLASVYEELGDLAKSRSLREETENPGAFYELPDPWIWSLYSDCYDAYRLSVAAGTLEQSGDSEAAMGLLRRASTLAPQDPDIRFQISNLLFSLGRHDEARSEMEICVKVAPDYEEAWVVLANYFRVKGNVQKADEMLVEGIRNCPGSPVLRLGWGRRLVLMKHYEEAARQFEDALDLHVEEADPYVELAIVYFQLRRFDEGKKILHDALNAEPGHPGALTILALQAIRSGDQKSSKHWLQLLERQPNAPPQEVAGVKQFYQKSFGNR